MTSSKGPIYVLSNHHFVNKVTYTHYAWLPANRVNEEMPGRASWLEAFGLIYEYNDRLYFKNGKKYNPGDIDKAFPDPQNRWMTNFLKADETGRGPASYSWHYERLRMIELYCRIRNEDPWPHAPEQFELPL
ncbi:hypothetical protein LP7551_04178 [Roseibium album]|nr:hypothetical protein LP7551_04178 [Roseibium album]